MSTITVSAQSISKWLGHWYKALICNQLRTADHWKKKVDDQIMEMEEDQTLLIYYSLLTLRHKLLTEQEDTNHYFKTIHPFKEKMGPLLTHYFHLFTGMCEVFERNYTEALQHYSSAEKYLDQIPDEKEKAEYHYRVSSVYYYIRQTELAFKHVNEAKVIFDADPDYLHRSAHCEILLGLCHLSNRDFSRVEEHFKNALNLAESLEDEGLNLHIHYNFGFLFAEKGDSNQAIRYLKKVNAAGFNPARSTFLLAREYFKTGRNHEAIEEINKGMHLCKETENVEYLHHFRILKAFHGGSKAEIESSVKYGVAYFKEHQLDGYVDDYLTQLANYLCETNDYQNTDVFF